MTQALAYDQYMAKSIRASAARLGSRGGRAGIGAAKRRGDSEFYRRLVSRRKDRQATGMPHRHLNHQDYTLAAIDDIISNGQRAAWERLRLALLQQADIREKILQICNARVHVCAPSTGSTLNRTGSRPCSSWSSSWRVRFHTISSRRG
jgi:hypothetical protein